MLKITYLDHSGFAVETDECLFLIDPISKIPEKILRIHKPLFFLISHGHHDHFEPGIFKLAKDRKDVFYILSNDIKGYSVPNAVFAAKGDQLSYTIGGKKVTISLFGTTDLGVSFLVETPSTRFFHSGDLNWWAWDTVKRPHINPDVEERDYKRELALLIDALGAKRLDAAMVPVDPRLDDGTYKAALYFIEKLHPAVLIPMHFWGKYGVIKGLIERTEGMGVFIPLFDHPDELVLDEK